MATYIYEEMTQAQATAFGSGDRLVFQSTSADALTVDHASASGSVRETITLSSSTGVADDAATPADESTRTLIFDGQSLAIASGLGRLNFTDDSALLVGTDEANRLNTATQDGQNDPSLIYGFKGDDFLTGGAGIDTIYGGQGNDTIVGNGSASGQTDLPDQDGDLTISGGDILFGGIGADTITGTAGSDDIYGQTSDGSQDLTLDGGDSIDAGAGDDYVNGQFGDDLILGGLGIDNLVGGDGNDTIFGNSNVTQPGDSADLGDSIFGGAGNDTIQGNAGDDYLVGGIGADVIGGGTGNDIIYGDDDQPIIIPGGPILPGDASLLAAVAVVSSDDIIRGGLGDDQIHGGDGNDDLTGGSNTVRDTADGDDTVYGENGNDTLQGNAGDDYLSGGNGNDQVGGGLGNDRVFGNDGDDRLIGGFGDDTLVGGAGVDTISGAGDRDTFVFATGDAAIVTDANGASRVDQIRDFDTSDERIDLNFQVGTGSTAAGANDAIVTGGGVTLTTFDAALTFAQGLYAGTGADAGDVVALQVGSDTYLFYGNNGADQVDNAILLSGVTATSLTEANFITFND